MSNRFTGAEVDPDIGILLPRWIGNQRQTVSRLDSAQMSIATRKDDPVDRRPKAARVICRQP